MEKEITNPFEAGQLVVCVREDFPWIPAYGGIGESPIKPRLYEQLTVDEVLGDFVRFDRYDTPESNNWWKHDRFAPVDLSANAFEVLREAVGSAWTQEFFDEYFSPDTYEVAD